MERMKTATTLLNEPTIDTARLKKAEKIWARHGIKRADAINIFIAQTIVRNNFPIVIGTDDNGGAMRSPKEQLDAWNDAFGEY